MRLTRYVVIIAALTGIGMGVVSLRARVTRIGYRVADERARQRTLLEERARLRFELARLTAPDRLSEQADALDLRLLPPDDGDPDSDRRRSPRPMRMAGAAGRRR